MTMHAPAIGLGFRRELLNELEQNAQSLAPIQFFEFAPENWIGIGGKLAKRLQFFTEQYPFIGHGLSLNLGGFKALDIQFLTQLKQFIKQHHLHFYSEHLSYSADDGHLYDLLPIPFTQEAVYYVAQRIRQVQDFLEQRIAIENISYYALPCQDLTEIAFLNAVLAEADCDLLLDVNNVYVNAFNHGYDAIDFLKQIPKQRIRYLHIAGHEQVEKDLIIDTHGMAVIPSVWQLLEVCYQQLGVFPTLLERDFNLPPLVDLLEECKNIEQLQKQFERK